MRIYEHETKDLFEGAGIPVPRRFLVRAPEEAEARTKDMGAPVALKAQTLIKARGKAGLIRFADTPRQAAGMAQALLTREHHGERIEKLLVEEKIAFERELYLGCVFDYTGCRPTLIVSPDGGVDIEEISRTRPQRILKTGVSPSAGLTDHQAGEAAEFLIQGLAANREKAVDIIHRAYCLFTARDLEMLEINPLVYSADRGLMALDGAASVDEEALVRQPDLVAARGQSQAEFERELDFRRRGWSYVQFDGDIGVLSSGAGVTMAILDLMRQAGGRPANFLDTAQMNRRGIYDAFHIFQGAPAIKTVIINIFAGLNRCDHLAQGIRDFLEEHKPPFKMVIRMVGNREEEGHQILQEIGITPLRGLEAMVAEAIRVTEEQG